jgi:hypothetical protein
MSQETLDEILLSKQRYAVADLVVQLTERARDDMLPSMTTWEFFQEVMIIRAMYEMQERGEEALAINLSQSTTIPLLMLEERLKELLAHKAIEQRGTGYVLAPEFFNSEFMLRGFRMRRLIIKTALEGMEEPDVGS